MLKIIKKDALEIKMIVETEFEEHRFSSFFDKEPETVDWIRTFFAPGDIFFDVGANVGVYSLLAATLYKEKIKIYAFEPAYHNFDKLCRNIIANDFKDVILPYGAAVGDETKFDVINLASDISGSANHLVAGAPEQLLKGLATAFKQGIFVASFDDLVAKFNIPVPNHIKIDTDGFEEKIVRGGAKHVFPNSNLKSVLIEITDTDGSKERIIKMMRSHGLKADHPINFQQNHSRQRRQKNNKSNIENIIFSR